KFSEESVSDPEVATFIEAVQPGVELVVAYELSVRRADELADRLRHEAERVWRLTSVRATRSRIDWRERERPPINNKPQCWSVGMACGSPWELSPRRP